MTLLSDRSILEILSKHNSRSTQKIFLTYTFTSLSHTRLCKMPNRFKLIFTEEGKQSLSAMIRNCVKLLNNQRNNFILPLGCRTQQLRMSSDEVKKAQEAQPGGDTIFGKILRKEIPCVSFLLSEIQLNLLVNSENL